MKSGFKLFIGVGLIIIIYIVASLILMNNNLHVVHYYGYENFSNAMRRKGVINPNVKYNLKGFSNVQQGLLRDNIFIYTTKSRYEEFYGFLIRLDRTDKERIRVNIELKNSDSIGKIFDAQVRLDDKYVGLIYGASFDVPSEEHKIILDVVAYQISGRQNIGQIEIQLK